MPVISGFHALTYDPAIDPSKVVTPPYDVIDAATRKMLATRHPNNFVHIDLPEALPGIDRYRAAAETLSHWRAHNILRRDPRPVLYRYDQEFTNPDDGQRMIRRGVLASVALSPWSERVLRPHEATLAAPREDRARLLAATRVHLSPVFAAYDDPDRTSDALLATHSGAPDRTASTDDGTVHKLWRIASPEMIARWSALLRDKCVYMLDGHHRCETMVAFGGRPSDDPAPPHGLMFLVAVTEPGLVVLPTHRIVHGPAALNRERFLTEIANDFGIQLRFGAARDASRLRAELAAAAGRTAFAAVFPRSPDAYLLTMRDQHARGPLTPAVSLLHELVIPRALAAGGTTTPDLQFISNTSAALDQIVRGEGRLALFVRAPSLDEIKRVADAGRVMPQKSTYFFPKLASGLVVMPIDP
jgi:uncharacterized protein (DUF1015 family)